MNYRPQRGKKHSHIICLQNVKEIMKLIFRNGSLSHTILLIANSVSIADDFITRPVIKTLLLDLYY